MSVTAQKQAFVTGDHSGACLATECAADPNVDQPYHEARYDLVPEMSEPIQQTESRWLLGDFYNAPDDVTRGVSLGTFSLETNQDKDDFGDVPQFSDCVAAAELLEDDLQGATSATLVILHSTAASAAKVASCLHTFLKEETSASFSKVRTAKFAITADVFDEVNDFSVHCKLKVRVFRIGNNSKLAVDFQRRAGDAVAFSHVFKRAVAHLRGEFEEQPIQAAHSEADKMPTIACDTSLQALQPLVDMAAASSPALQAEALTALACAAGVSPSQAMEVCDQLAGVQMSQNGGLVGLADLLTSRNALVLAYPAARLATTLCQTGVFCSGRAALEQESLRRAISQVMCARSCADLEHHLDPLVRRQLQKLPVY